jgi:hypothetical protein
MISAYVADKINSTRTKKREQEKLGIMGRADEEGNIPAGDAGKDPNEFEPPIPFTAYEVYAHLIPEEEGKVWALEEDVQKS